MLNAEFFFIVLLLNDKRSMEKMLLCCVLKFRNMCVVVWSPNHEVAAQPLVKALVTEDAPTNPWRRNSSVTARPLVTSSTRLQSQSYGPGHDPAEGLRLSSLLEAHDRPGGEGPAGLRQQAALL